jgi:two-component system sensor histidine kinase QseC
VFDVEVEPGCSVHGDPAALSAMVDNLLDNAVKYGRDESKEAGKVEVRVVRESGQVCLAVMDDGPGVAEQDRPRLADRFYRVAGNRASGSGLGLSIVDRIVKRFGASLRIGEGIGGQGLGIRISFPS